MGYEASPVRFGQHPHGSEALRRPFGLTRGCLRTSPTGPSSLPSVSGSDECQWPFGTGSDPLCVIAAGREGHGSGVLVGSVDLDREHGRCRSRKCSRSCFPISPTCASSGCLWWAGPYGYAPEPGLSRPSARSTGTRRPGCTAVMNGGSAIGRSRDRRPSSTCRFAGFSAATSGAPRRRSPSRFRG